MPQTRRFAARKSIAITGTAIGLTLLASLRPAHAQPVYRTSASFGGINYSSRNQPTASLYGDSRYSGANISVSGAAATYSFNEGSGADFGTESDTIRISGSGAASSAGLGFTDLKSRVTADLNNAYLDLRDIENAPVGADGLNAPSTWIANVSAGWTLTSRFNSASAAPLGTYTVKWIFGVDGTENTNNGGHGLAYLGFSYGSNRANFFTTSLLPQLWATDSMPLLFGQGLETSANFNTNWQYSMIQDGEKVFDADDVLIGYRAPSSLTGTVNYSNTVKLADIQVFDQSGNRFYDFSVDDGSGNVIYRASPAGADAPEPGSLGLLGLGLATAFPTIYRRRRRDIIAPGH